MARSFSDVQAFFAFLNVLQDETKRVDINGNAVNLLSNLDPSGDTNTAVELAKIYSWYQACVDFDSVHNKLTIKAAAIPDSFEDVKFGFYDSTTGNFYTDSTKATIIPPDVSKIYVATNENKCYRYNDSATPSAKYETIGGEDTTYSFREGTTPGAFEVQESGSSWQTVYIHDIPTLDTNGKIPSSFLPSYVDDVIEGYKVDDDFYDEPDCVYGYKYNGNFYSDSGHTTQITPAADTVYVDQGVTPNTAWVWDSDTSAYISATPITPESGKIYLDKTTDTTWRWSGTQYTQIKGDLALGTSHSDAYYGDYGQLAYRHSQNLDPSTGAAITTTETPTATNPHGIGKSDVGLGNVDNTADASKEVLSATKLKTKRTIDGVEFDGTANITHYGTCSTTASTAAKTVACTGFKLETGARIEVRFTTTNTAAVGSLTLSVNSTTAKAIKYRNENLPDAGVLAAGRTYVFVYDGTYYQLEGDLDSSQYDPILILHCTQNPSVIPNS